jgi:hypothetical protein
MAASPAAQAQAQSRLDHLKICMDCTGEGTRHVTDSGKGSLPIRRTVNCTRCGGEGLIYVGPAEGRAEAMRRLHGGKRSTPGVLAAAVDLKESGDAAYRKGDYDRAVARYGEASQLDRAYLAPVANRSGAYLKMEKWQECRRDCARVLKDADCGSDLHLRACLRRAVASSKGVAEDLRACLVDVDVLLRHQPGHPEALQLRAEASGKLGGLGQDAPPPPPPADSIDPIQAAVAACKEVAQDAASAPPPPPTSSNFDSLE